MAEEKFLVKVVGIIFDPKKRKILIGRKKGEEKYSFIEEYLDYTLELEKLRIF